MVIFKSVEYKNFMAVGDNSIKIDLTRSPTTLISGKNGHGKSSIAEAISFALFGKAYRNIKKTQLINSINNKGCVVIIKFSVNGHDYEVIRGMKPNKFEIYKDGTLINQDSNARDYQKFLEQSILNLTYKSFCQTVILGNANFTPFMQLPTYQRREIIEDLLDINIFSKMNIVIKESFAKLKDRITDNKYKLTDINNRIEVQESYIADLRKVSNVKKTEVDEEIERTKKEATELVEQLEEQQALIFTPNIDDNIANMQIGLEDALLDKNSVEYKMKDAREEITFLEENDTCSKCSQDISHDHKEERKAKLIESSVEWVEKIAKFNDTIAFFKDNIKSLTAEKDAQQKRDSEVKRLMSLLKVHKKKLNNLEESITLNDTTGDSISKAQAELLDLMSIKDDLNIERIELNTEREYNEAMIEMLKDTGIKTKIIKQYLPVMNNLINKYLQVLDFFVSFNIDENFSETIKSRYRDEFTYSSFSEGEKARIDIALLMTWREISRTKNSNSTNLLILDEIFDSSLDADGAEYLMKIIDTLHKDTNTFVISHKTDMLENKLRAHIKFKKDGNFSKIC